MGVGDVETYTWSLPQPELRLSHLTCVWHPIFLAMLLKVNAHWNITCSWSKARKRLMTHILVRETCLRTRNDCRGLLNVWEVTFWWLENEWLKREWLASGQWMDNNHQMTWCKRATVHDNFCQKCFICTIEDDLSYLWCDWNVADMQLKEDCR